MNGEEGKNRFEITRDHIGRGRANRNPLAIALQENGLMQNPEVRVLSTIETDRTGEKAGTFWHSPPVTRWLKRWERGEEVPPLGVILDRKRRRINTVPGPGRK